MCYFITISFPKEFKEIVRTHLPSGVRLDRNKNSFFVQSFGKEFLSKNITDGHCSCSLYTSLLKESESEETEQLIKKYQRKGWSQNKIDSALSNIERKPKKDSIDLRSMISNIVREIGSVLLFAHMYSGLVETEELRAGDSRTLRTSEFLNPEIEIAEDEFVKIIA